MIVDTNTNPKREIYYLGALTIEILKNKSSINLFDLYQELNAVEEISMRLFLFVLDWLYIIDSIKHDDGKIKLCF